MKDGKINLKELDLDKVIEKAGSHIDVSKDFEHIKAICPQDTYDKINSAIEESDLPVEEKIRLFKQNREDQKEACRQAADVVDEVRDSKIKSIFKYILIIGGASYWLYELFKGNADAPETITDSVDSDLISDQSQMAAEYISNS